MRNILSKRAAPVLDRVAREQMLLVFDFDGTLAPIVEAPVVAAMRASTKALLRIVAMAYPCAVVSGRSRADLLPRLGTIPLAAVVGNHGAESGHGPMSRSLRRVVAAWVATLDGRLRGIPGVEIEDKGITVAIHYRRASSRAAALRAIRTATAWLPGARVFDGHFVVNVVPLGAPNKGTAVGQLLARTGRPAALYVGDDTTDEDALAHPGVAVGIRVGRARSSAATYYLASQGGIDSLLRALVRASRTVLGLEQGSDELGVSIAAGGAARRA